MAPALRGSCQGALLLLLPATAPAEALLRQGITTVLINPDGGGPVDLAAQRRGLAAAAPGVNVVQMIGHNAVRGAVLGSADRDPTPEELARMAALVRRGFEAGAFTRQATGSQGRQSAFVSYL